MGPGAGVGFGEGGEEGLAVHVGGVEAGGCEVGREGGGEGGRGVHGFVRGRGGGEVRAD